MDYTFNASGQFYFATPKTDWRDEIQVEVGDSKQSDTFYPQLKIMRFGNEVNVSLRLDVPFAGATVAHRGGNIRISKPEIEVSFYEISACSDHPEGAHEFEIILNKKPESNVLKFTVVDKGVQYYYQPELTKEEVEMGCERPESVVGSYAVYSWENKINRVNGKQYRSGKIGHIFRPKIVDFSGAETWGQLYIANGTLLVTIPQDFLDKAIYPVRHAAGLTFGYTTLGASQVLATNTVYASVDASGGTGTGVSITAGTRRDNAEQKHKCALYDNQATSNLIENGTTEERTGTVAKGWEVFTFPSAPAITNATYKIAIWTSGAGYAHYDATSGTNKYNYYTLNYAASWPSTIAFNNFNNYSVSNYATYTESGGGASTVPVIMNSYRQRRA